MAIESDELRGTSLWWDLMNKELGRVAERRASAKA
jgi:hypothetical protein